VGGFIIDEGSPRTILRSYRNIRSETTGTPLELVDMLANHTRPSGVASRVKFILRDPSNNEHWILRAQGIDYMNNFVRSAGSQTHWERLGSEVFGSAETIDWSRVKLYAVGGEFNESMYFALDGKVYVYNIYEDESYLMLDKGPGYEITYLNFFGLGAGSNRDIFVGSFDGTYGTLERYVIPPRPDPFEIARRANDEEFRFGPQSRFVDPFSGLVTIGAQFGRIVDINYK
jgi:hypothetical protein